MRRFAVRTLAAVGLCCLAHAQLRELKPGFNLFSPQQDVQIGHEYAGEVERQMTVVHNARLNAYLRSVLDRLRRSPRAGDFPYSIAAVYDKNINAFSLPGGPIYIDTGLLAAIDNEGQLAGVIGHEMSHIVLRHSTSQLSKQNLLQIPAMLAGSMGDDSILGKLTKAGLTLGAGSLLLKFSRADEAQADYNGAIIMADAGYNPIELANFFEKLQAQAQSGGSLAGFVSRFLSDHPDPGNRVKAVEDEVQEMPQRSYGSDTGRFVQIKALVKSLPAPPPRPTASKDQNAVSASTSGQPASRLRSYRGSSFVLSYPDDWQVSKDRSGHGVTIAPEDGIVPGSDGQGAIAYGLETNYFFPQGDTVDLDRDTQALIRQLRQQNPTMLVAQDPRPVTVGGRRGLSSVLNCRSPLAGETEADTLVTVARPEGLFYLVFVTPRSRKDQTQGTIESILQSIRFQ
jgi:Zn-dependent protease with chaperone function